MSREGWEVQRETDPPGQKSKPVTWAAAVREPEPLKSADKTAVRAVGELPGRNASDHRGGLENINPKGRALECLAKAAWDK